MSRKCFDEETRSSPWVGVCVRPVAAAAGCSSRGEAKSMQDTTLSHLCSLNPIISVTHTHASILDAIPRHSFTLAYRITRTYAASPNKPSALSARIFAHPFEPSQPKASLAPQSLVRASRTACYTHELINSTRLAQPKAQREVLTRSTGCLLPQLMRVRRSSIRQHPPTLPTSSRVSA